MLFSPLNEIRPALASQHQCTIRVTSGRLYDTVSSILALGLPIYINLNVRAIFSQTTSDREPNLKEISAAVLINVVTATKFEINIYIFIGS